MLAVRALRAALLLAPLWFAPPRAAAADGPACPPAGWSLERLQALKAQRWQIDDPAVREQLAQDLLPCLRARDPAWRDDIAFEALQAWLRAGALGDAGRRALGRALLAALDAPDPDGFGPPFAALALSEVARSDRLAPFWRPEERQAVLDAAVRWMQAVHDYRGFEPVAGWRHAVAHGADLLLQLALNPALDKGQLDAILAAVRSQAMPASGHSYVHGEGERLARPVLFVARRGLHGEAEWNAWFGGLAAAAVGAPGAPVDLAALARVHDLKALLLPLYVAVMEGGDAALRDRLRPGLVAALKALP